MGVPDPAGAAALSARGVEAHYADTRAFTATAVEAALALLSPEERARHDRLGAPADRRDYAAAHALLRVALSARLGTPPGDLRFTTDAYGNAALAQPADVSFSLARSPGLVACAIGSGCAVGIDVEVVDPSVRARDLAGRFFARSEAIALEACAAGERPGRFAELWTLKEAMLKASGTGLGWPLNCAAFDLQAARVTVAQLPQFAPARWAFLLVRLGATHRLAVAVGQHGG
jgi:4'-phosphopantetheinyl transferase